MHRLLEGGQDDIVDRHTQRFGQGLQPVYFDLTWQRVNVQMVAEALLQFFVCEEVDILSHRQHLEGQRWESDQCHESDTDFVHQSHLLVGAHKEGGIKVICPLLVR